MPGGTMSFAGTTPTKFGQYQIAPALRPGQVHVHDGGPLKEVSHTVAIGVLDQEDLDTQGIDTSKLIPGARKVTALGSCTCNSGTAHLATQWVAAGKDLAGLKLTAPGAGTFGVTAADSKGNEEFAIVLYDLVTHQTGQASTEWPPTDCGSSGFYVCEEFERQGLAASSKTASGVLGALSLLQTTTVMQGAPFLNAWMQPDSDGFVDGDGSYAAFRDMLAQGVAGGHETLMFAAPQVAQLKNGTVELARTVVEYRNSWDGQWGLSGNYKMHASTLNYLAQYVDYKAAVVA